MLKKTLKTKAFRALLPFALAAIFGLFSVRMAGDRPFPFFFSVCAGLFAGGLLGTIIKDWE